MSSRSNLLPFLFLFLASLQTLSAASLTDARWNGRDFVMTFSDSVRYVVDLAESDSTRVVIRVDGVDAASVPSQRQLPGPDQRSAVLTAVPGGIRLTITAPTRLGYSTIQHRYSNRMVVHTFDWNGLSYGEDQYHKGLLAIEGQYNEAAEEMLKIAESTGEHRARSALGAFYLAQGKDSLAGRYLDSAVTADDHAALAELRRRRGDSVSAGREAEIARMMIADENAGATTAAPESRPLPQQGPRTSRITNEMYYLGGGALLLILIIAAIFFFTRNKPAQSVAATEGRITPKRPTPIPTAPPVFAVDPAPAPVVEKAPPVTPVVEQSVEKPIEASVIAPAVETAPTPVIPLPAEPQPVPMPEPAPAVEAKVEEERIPPVTTVEEMPEEAVPAITTVTEVEERFPAVTTIQELEPAGNDDTAPAPIVTAHPGREVEAADVRPESEEQEFTETVSQIEAGRRPGQRLPSQAAALQRKIQSVRRDAPAPAEPTVHAARRLNVSRDNVELRKMMEEAARRNREAPSP